MIIDYDHNPALTQDQKLQSLQESVQMAMNEVAASIEELRQEIKKIEREDEQP